jgi:uncharacterized membrane protein YdjX (TVP38/TMEM64 family)
LRALRIIIVSLIVVSMGAFFWLTAGTDAQTLVFERIMVTDQRLVLMVLLLCAFTLFSTLTGLPVLYLSMAIGFLLNFTPALLICLGMNLLSVMATFYLVRRAFTGYFQEKYGQKKLISRMNKRIGKYGLWTVVFSRGIYIIPTNVINFSFPLSRIHPRVYLLGTVLGLIPECLINVGSGYLIRHELMLLSSPESRGWQALAIGAFILLFALVFVILSLRQKRRKRFRRLKQIPYQG